MMMNIKSYNEIEDISRSCQMNSRYSDTYLYTAVEDKKYGVYEDAIISRKFNGGYNWGYKLISPLFSTKRQALNWIAEYLINQTTINDIKEMYQEGIFKVFDNELKGILGLDVERGHYTTSIFPSNKNRGIDPLPKYMTMKDGSAKNVERINYIKTNGNPYKYEESMSIKELNKKLSSLLEEYEVYSPSEESSEENVHRSKFDSKGIRNIMMSYFMGNKVQDVYNNIRNHIDKMSDEWVIEFLKNQDDTQVNKI